MLKRAEIIENLRSRYLKGSINKVLVKNAGGKIRTTKYVWFPTYGSTDGRFKPKSYFILTFVAHDTGFVIIFKDEIDHKTQKVLSRKEIRYTFKEFEEAQVYFALEIRKWLEDHRYFISKKLLNHTDEIITEATKNDEYEEEKKK